VLAAPQRAEEGEGITAAAIENALGLLRQEVDFLVVDLTRDFDDRSIAVLDRADAILVVTTPEVPALNRASGLLDLLKRLGCSPTSTHVVVNRYGPRPALSRRDLETFLKHTVDAEIPNDYPNAVACANEGRTIWTVAPKSALASALSELAVRINGWCGAPLELAPEKPERGLFGRFTRKRHGTA
jgi:pilus assembly protein CpaE